MGMVDLSLLFTIGLIFVITLIGAYMRSIRKDRCLKSWEGFHVTLERTNDKLIWGVLKVESTGMELAYVDSVQDDRHVESSYLLYGSEYGDIQAIYRYPEKLSAWGIKRRTRDIERSFHPGPLRRLGRSLRNFLSTATDSLNEVLGIVLGRVQKTGSRYLADGSSASIKNMVGTKVLGQVGAVFDPLLENYIGHRVVIELLEDGEVHEHVGILQEYSGDFIEVLDVQYPHPQTLILTPSGTYEAEGLVVSVEDSTVRVQNFDQRPFLVAALQGREHEQLINAVVDAGETITLHFDEKDCDQLKLKVQIVRELDMILPRTRCLVRHRAENVRKEDLSRVLMDIVFDVGRLVASDERHDHTEALLRQDVRRNPKDALAAANLGFLLLQKDELAEAEKWLRHALTMEYSLPDGGRRARMELREIERRHYALRPPFSSVRPVQIAPVESTAEMGKDI